MKNRLKIFASALLTLTLVGCSCSKPDVNATLSESKEIIKGDKTSASLTTKDIYEYIKESGDEHNKAFIGLLVKKILESEVATTKEKKEKLEKTYNYKLEKYFNDNFLEKDDYKVNGVFDEELLVAKLRNDLYKINDPIQGANQDNQVPPYSLGLTYDYSEYISAELDYDIYMAILKEDYIANNKSHLLNRSKTRIITTYSLSDVEDMEEIVTDLFDGKYASLEDLETTKKDEQKREIGRQLCENLGQPNEYYKDDEGNIIQNCTPTKSSYDTTYSKFTTCANNTKCTLDEGKDYQIKLIDNTQYLKEEVINKNSKDVLYANALSLLLREDVDDYLLDDNKMKSIFATNSLKNGNFLMSNVSDGSTFDEKSIILSSGTGSTCYLVLVRVVDETTLEKTDEQSLADTQKALELLLDNVSETNVLLHYVENMEIELVDSQIEEVFAGILGK